MQPTRTPRRGRRHAAVAALALVGAVAPTARAAAAEDGLVGVNVRITDASFRALSGACFDMYVDAGDGVLGDRVKNGICDTNGVLQVRQAPGQYVLVETVAPTHRIHEDGSQTPAMFARHPRIEMGLWSPTFEKTATHAAAGRMRIQARKPILAEPGWAPLPGACYTVVAQSVDPTIQGAFVRTEVTCDYYDGSLDGWAETTMAVGQSAATGLAIEPIGPEGWHADAAGAVIHFSNTSDETSVTFTANSDYVIRQRSQGGTTIVGGCYSVIDPSTNEFVLNVCDDWDGQADGTVQTDALEPGSYRFEEYQAPKGYELAAPFTMGPGSRNVSHTKRPWVTVMVNDPMGQVLTGACFAARDPQEPEGFLDEACDGDGTVDGKVELRAVPAGEWQLLQTAAPSGYRIAAPWDLSFGTADVTVTVVNESLAANRPPVAGADDTSTNEDTPVSGNVLTNDTDPEGRPLTARLVTAPTRGNVTLDSSGAFTYTPNADANGNDSFTYEVVDDKGLATQAPVAITVVPVNDPGVARPDSATVVAGQSVLIDVLANDSDVDGDPISVVLLSGDGNGTVSGYTGDLVRFTPNEGFVGTAWFTYGVVDRKVLSAPATVTITVTAPPPSSDCTIVGTEGNDRLRGTAGRDVICGLGGNDTIDGLGGDDVLRGGTGNDVIAGGLGNDTIDGGYGNDRLNGQGGADLISGGAGRDVVHGNAGDDVLSGDDDDDQLYGDAGADTIDGGGDNDEIFGGSGNDTIVDSLGRNRIVGGAGRDSINGQVESTRNSAAETGPTDEN